MVIGCCVDVFSVEYYVIVGECMFEYVCDVCGLIVDVFGLF